MIVATVAGTVVSTRRADGIASARYLLVDQCDQHVQRKNDYLVALDLIGAKNGEVVLVSQGSPCRQTPSTENKPMDAVIVGIIDLIDVQGNMVYAK